MGVDFTAYSHVVSRPLPVAYQSKKTGRTVALDAHALTRELIRKGASFADAAGVVDLKLCMLGIGRHADGSLVFPEEIEMPSDSLVDEFYAKYESDPDFICADWHLNIMYFKTAATQCAEAGRSYSGYGDFIDDLVRYNKNKPLSYVPPSTDSAPEHGIVDSARMQTFLSELDKLRHHYVTDDWDGASCEPAFIRQPDDAWHGHFFVNMYRCAEVAAQNGILVIS